jgi:hypothetical protein
MKTKFGVYLAALVSVVALSAVTTPPAHAGNPSDTTWGCAGRPGC